MKKNTKVKEEPVEAEPAVQQKEEQRDENASDYDEEEDEDYDPTSKQPQEQESESEDEEPAPDYSTIQAGASAIRTRNQRIQEQIDGPSKKHQSGLVQDTSRINVDSIFDSLKHQSTVPVFETVQLEQQEPSKPQPQTEQTQSDLEPTKILIETSYTFAGKVITESKLVDADSAEAKAYLNSTNIINKDKQAPVGVRSSIPVIRKLPNLEEQVELRIKLKRPSLIDKFLSAQGNKNLKLSTLEKSRLDWASFVDRKNIKDDLSLHNKAGYLDKQDFLNRLDAKRDEQYVKARDEDRRRQWQLQQGSS